MSLSADIKFLPESYLDTVKIDLKAVSRESDRMTLFRRKALTQMKTQPKLVRQPNQGAEV